MSLTENQWQRQKNKIIYTEQPVNRRFNETTPTLFWQLKISDTDQSVATEESGAGGGGGGGGTSTKPTTG